VSEIGSSPQDVWQAALDANAGQLQAFDSGIALLDAADQLVVSHFFERYMALLGMGSLVGIGGSWLGCDDREVGWGVLRAIGVAGLIALSFIRLPIWARLGIGLMLLGTYQVLLLRLLSAWGRNPLLVYLLHYLLLGAFALLVRGGTALAGDLAGAGNNRHFELGRMVPTAKRADLCPLKAPYHAWHRGVVKRLCRASTR